MCVCALLGHVNLSLSATSPALPLSLGLVPGKDMQDADFQQSIGSFIRLVLHMEAPSLRLWCDRPMALDVVQGRESPNCGLLVAMAAIADHHDGYLVRQLFPQFQDVEDHEDPL